MKISIIAKDKTVYVDGYSFGGIELTGIPDEVHALQWDGEKGHLESTNGKGVEIKKLPAWANTAVKKWEKLKTVDDAARAAEVERSNKHADKSKQSEAEKMLALRIERNNRLLGSDWTELPSVKALRGEEWVKAWQGYRQALRDLPALKNLKLDDPQFPLPPGLV